MTSFTSDFFEVCLLCMVSLFSKTMLEVKTTGLQWSRMAETDEFKCNIFIPFMIPPLILESSC